MTLNLLDWDEDLQTDSAEEYQALLNGLRRSQGFGLYFVQCSPFSGGKLIERLQTDLTDKKIAILKLEKPITDGNVFKRVSTFLAEQNPVDVLVIQGLENSLFDAEETKKRLGWSDEKANAYNWREVPPVLINLNQQRERFRDNFPICFVFLLPQYAIKYLIHRAPDFFDWRSGLINYASNAKTLAQESNRIKKDSDYDAYCTWSEDERKSRLFAIQTLIDEPKTTLETRARLYFEQGLLFTTARDFLASVTCFDKAVILKPDFHEALYNKGFALANLGQHEAAIAAYDQALAIQPDFHYAFYGKGFALANLGQHEAAIATYDQALAIQPDYHYALYGKGIALTTLGHQADAITCYTAVLDIKPEFYQALQNRGSIYFADGNLEKAIADFDAALKLQPENYSLNLLRTQILLQIGNPNQLTAAYQILVNAMADPKLLEQIQQNYQELLVEDLSEVQQHIINQVRASLNPGSEPLDAEALQAKIQAGQGLFAKYRDLIQSNPEAWGYIVRAFITTMSDDLDTAISQLQTAVGLEPEYREFLKDDLESWPNALRHDSRFRALVERE